MPHPPKPIIGVMGPGQFASEIDLANAFALGQRIAQQEWIVLCGGRKAGVMDAVCRGAKSAGGQTIGILPGDNRAGMSESVDIPIVTGMGNARNNINVLTSDVVIACGIGAGTASEVALALKANKNVILLTENETSRQFFKNLYPEKVTVIKSPAEAIELAGAILSIKE
ncbi:MAG: cytochrome [bacterium]